MDDDDEKADLRRRHRRRRGGARLKRAVGVLLALAAFVFILDELLLENPAPHTPTTTTIGTGGMPGGGTLGVSAGEDGGVDASSSTRLDLDLHATHVDRHDQSVPLLDKGHAQGGSGGGGGDDAGGGDDRRQRVPTVGDGGHAAPATNFITGYKGSITMNRGSVKKGSWIETPWVAGGEPSYTVLYTQLNTQQHYAPNICPLNIYTLNVNIHFSLQ
jgi:hypothetical protein